jgi:uncharacterized protein with HEPN domain
MNPRDVRKYLFDIEKACRLIMEFTRGVDRERFLEDQLLQSAVERKAEIVGEAPRQALEVEPSLSERIADVRAVIAFRNRLAHGYSDISPKAVWEIVKIDVPRLLDEVRQVMGERSEG